MYTLGKINKKKFIKTSDFNLNHYNIRTTKLYYIPSLRFLGGFSYIYIKIKAIFFKGTLSILVNFP